jgi:hypothetical protein
MARKPNLAGQIPPTIAPRKPVDGPLSAALLKDVKANPSPADDEARILAAVKSLSADDLRAALTAATPQEHNLLFNALPGDAIQGVLSAQPVSVLAPAAPPPAVPAPTGGPPASILTTTFENVPYPAAAADPNWSQTFSSGSTIGITSPPPWEWVSVYDQTFEKEGSLNNPMVGLTGWVVSEPDISGADNPGQLGDVPFVHPFGALDSGGNWTGDWEFYIAPDPQYEGLLASSNTGVNPTSGAKDGDFSAANTAAHNIGLTAPKGVLGVETDQGLVPEAFRSFLTAGTRVAAFGRWIVDCGHDDFHTEIHAPLMLAAAKVAPPPAGRQGASEMTTVQLVSRPYTVSQRFDEGNFIDHLLTEVAKVEWTTFGIPHSWRVEAHPTVFTTPYQGRPYVKLLIQPPPPPRIVSPIITPRKLMVSFHMTHRTGVAAEVYDAGNGTVGLVLVFGDLNPATLPPKHDLTIQWSQLGDKYSYIIDLLQIADILTLDILPAVVLNRGILTDRYDPPQASSRLDNQNVVTPTPIDKLATGVGFSEDDDQPFPVYGWINVWWETENLVTEPIPTRAPAQAH